MLSVKDENSSISVLRAELSKTLALAKYEGVDQYCNNPPRLLEGSGTLQKRGWLLRNSIDMRGKRLF